MKTAILTLAAIDKAVLAEQEYPHRTHLGASVIGDACQRRVWYNYRWTKRKEFSGQTLRLFDRGHKEEKRFVGFVRAAGVEIWEAGEDGDMKSKMRVTAHHGHFGGTPDGIGRKLPDLPANTPFIAEFKTHNYDSFKYLKDSGLIKAKWEHFVQCQIYMHGHKLKHAVYWAVCKDNDELFCEIIDYDEAVALGALEKAERVIFGVAAPKRISENPAYYICKMCHLNEICHYGRQQQAEKNCRTCEWAKPVKDAGKWECGLYKVNINPELMRTGCASWTIHSEITPDVPF